MKNETNKKSLISSLFMATLIAIMIAGSFVAQSFAADRLYPKTIEELDGLRAGAVVGSIIDQVTEENFPNSEIFYVNTYADMLESVRANKIDYFIIDAYKAVHMLGHTDEIILLEDVVNRQPFGFIFKKNDAKAAKLKAQFNEFIKTTTEDGRLQKLQDKWLDTTGESVDNAVPLEYELTGENGTLNMAASNSTPPYVFMLGDEANGFDVELAYMFCEEYGYGLEFSMSDFAGIIPAVQSGKCDFGASSLTITPERAENVDFSDVYAWSAQVPVVPNDNSETSFFAGIKKSFLGTFVTEDRWKMICSGLLTTLEMFIAATLLGTIIGLFIYMLCRKGNKPLNGFFDGFAWIFSGLPMVVVLMIFYYIVFAKSSTDGVVTSIIAFTISVMLSVYSLMKTSVKAIDVDQIEGAYSLGFTDRQTFLHIVLPQAMEQFVPNYKTNLINTLKGTAIVGYIAVQDLTKVSDVIRARTYDAFFPLIATAIIYLILVLLLSELLKKVEFRFQPMRRSEEKVLKQYSKK